MDEEAASSSGFPNSCDRDSGFDATSREAMYKNKGMTSDAMRKRREEACAEMRKARRYDDLNKRRQIDLAPSDADEESGRELAGTPMDERIVAKLCGECPEEIEEALDFYRRRFRTSDASDVADEIVALNLIPRIVDLLQTGSTFNIRRTATHVVGAIVSICSMHTEAVVKSGVVPHLIDLINNPDHEIRELTLFALGNIAGECCQYRDLCISHGMAEKMTMVPDGTMTLMEARCAVWAASNLCRGKDPPVDLEKIAVLLPLFNEALYSSDSLIISDACRAFGRLLDATPESSYKDILKPSTIECLVEHMGNPNSKISLAALLAVGNIVSGDDEQTQSVLNCANALNYIHRLLLDGEQKTKREVCWVLSNITAGTSSQIQTIFDAGIIPSLIQILKTETFQVRSEACWVIANAISGGNREHISQIVREGALIPLSDMLTVMDCSVVVVVLKALAEILDCGEYCKVDGQNPYATRLEELNVIDKLEFLMLSANTEIFFKACAIMEKYYLREDDEDINNDNGVVRNHKLNNFSFS
uniref:Importin subunit alpha n=1 Tax=Elaeophora elaphi TaxID=1147741 RepID=A0A158Q8R1_9BILA